jgi:drug/metabolite transporter (DMT)-like permease
MPVTQRRRRGKAIDTAMTYTAVILLTISAFFHVFYNALFKKGCPDRSFVPSMALAYVIINAPLFVLSLFLVRMPVQSVMYAIIGGTFIAFYFYALARAYRLADFTLVYPLARSAPIFMVVWVAVLSGVFPSALGLCGILAVVGGCFLLPFESFHPGRTGLSLASYWNKASLWALAAAFTTSFYSLADKKGVSLAPGIPGVFCYLFIESFATMVVLAGLAVFIDKEKAYLRYFRRNLPVTFTTAALCGIGYVLVLLAFQTESNVSYMVGFRQLSVVIGVIFGGLFMTEKVTAPRMVGALAIFAGLVIIAVAK